MKILRNLNNKGMTIVELLVCFLIVTVISTSLFTTISSFNDKRNIESLKSKLLSYKSTVVKEIQDDIVSKGLINSSLTEDKTNAFYTITLTFKDSSMKKIGIRNKSSQGYSAGDLDTGDDTDGDGATDTINCRDKTTDDDFYITYGKEIPSNINDPEGSTGSYVLYRIPNVGTSVNECDEKVYDLRFKNVDVESDADNGLVIVFINFEHPDLQYGYSIDMVVPLNYNVQSDQFANDVVTTTCNFSTDSWDTIANNIENSPSCYNVGDEKSIDLGDLGVHNVRIVNKSSPGKCSQSGFSQTACGFVIEFLDGFEVSEGLTLGWPTSNAHTYANDIIYNALPSDLKSMILDTYVVSGNRSTGMDNLTSTDKLYLLSPREYEEADNPSLENAYSKGDTSYNSTRQLDFYSLKNIRQTKGGPSLIYKKADGVKINATLRSYSTLQDNTVYYISTAGKIEYGADFTSTYGIAPAFRIG